MGSAVLHETNLEVAKHSIAPVDQGSKDERTALRRAKILEKRTQPLGGPGRLVVVSEKRTPAAFGPQVVGEEGRKMQRGGGGTAGSAQTELFHCWHVEWLAAGGDEVA